MVRRKLSTEAYIKQLEVTVIFMFLLGGFIFPALMAENKQLRCVKEERVESVVNGVMWPLLGSIHSLMYLKGMSNLESRCYHGPNAEGANRQILTQPSMERFDGNTVYW